MCSLAMRLRLRVSHQGGYEHDTTQHEVIVATAFLVALHWCHVHPDCAAWPHKAKAQGKGRRESAKGKRQKTKGIGQKRKA